MRPTTPETKTSQHELLEHIVRELNDNLMDISQAGSALGLGPKYQASLGDLQKAMGIDEFRALREMGKAVVRAGGKLPPMSSRGQLLREMAAPTVAYANMVAVEKRTSRHVASLGTYLKAVRTQPKNREKLKQLVDSWLDVQPDFAAWTKKNLALSRELHAALAKMRPLLRTGKDGRLLPMLFFPVDQRDRPVARARYEPYLMFLQIAVGLDIPSKLGRCRWCRRYYVNASGRRDSAHCKTLCGKRESAIKATRKREERERQRKVNESRRAYFRGRQSRRAVPDWREYVALATGYTRKFLTFNRKAITSPPSKTGRQPKLRRKPR